MADRPSMVAVTVELPADTAVSTPPVVMVATGGAALLHVIVRPVSTFPLPSNAVAVNDCVLPTRRLTTDGVMLTVATPDGVTVMVARSVIPSTVADTVADPGEMAVSIPCGDTAAIAGVALLQVTGRPVSTAPLAS